MVPLCTALVLGAALLPASLTSGSAIPVEYSIYPDSAFNRNGSSLAARMDSAGTMAAGVSDPIDYGTMQRLQKSGQRLLARMQGEAVEREQRRVAAQQVSAAGWSKYVTNSPSPMPHLSHIRGAVGVEGFLKSEGYFGFGNNPLKKNGITLDPRNWAYVRQIQDKPYSTDSDKLYDVSAHPKRA